MSDQEGLPGPIISVSSIIRPLSVRMPDELRAQIDIVAQLNDRSVTEEVRVALEQSVKTRESGPKVLELAEAVRAELERGAAPKGGAIEAVFALAEVATSCASCSAKPE